MLKSEYRNKRECPVRFFGRRLLLFRREKSGMHAMRNDEYRNLDSAILQSPLVLMRRDAHGVALIDGLDPPFGDPRRLPNGIDDNRLETLPFLPGVQRTGGMMVNQHLVLLRGFGCPASFRTDRNIHPLPS